MEIVRVISSLSPIAQVAFVLASFATIFLLAYNRNAGENLIAFLRDLCNLFQFKGLDKSQGSNSKQQKKSVLSHALSLEEKNGQSMERRPHGK